MVDVKEGFLCPICLTDLGDFIQLQLHFEEKHSKDADPAFVQNIKELFGKAKKKILVASEDETFQALVSEFSILDPGYGPGPTDYNPVSGIHYNILETDPNINLIHSVNHIDFFRTERSKRADMKAMDTNKLILRLDRLMTSLPPDPVKRRQHEQSIVTWLPEDDVKLCPNCARSFNITRRKHHCRLCGAVMCADCSTSVSFALAHRVIHPATIAKYSPDKEEAPQDQRNVKSKFNTPKKSYDALVSNLVDLTGFTESQAQFRSCCYCKEVLDRRDARVQIATQPPSKLVLFYNQLQKFVAEGVGMSKKYCEMAAGLNAGELGQEQLGEAKILRMKLLKMAEIVDITSKKIVSMDLEDGGEDQGIVETLKKRIRASAVNFIKDTLVGLPSVPTEEELEKLKANRKKEAERKIAEEKTKAQEAKVRYEQQQLQQQAALQSFSPASGFSSDHPVKKFLSPSASSNNLEAVKSQLSNAYDGFKQKAALVPKKSLFGNSNPTPAQRSRPVTFGNGFVATASEAGGPDLDPLVQQMHNLRQFISQARSAGKIDDAKLLEQNLRDLREEYQKVQERRELEENYIHFKSVLGSKSPIKGSNQTQQVLDESNPFAEELDNDEEDVLNDPTNPFAENGDEEIDDDSGTNPFFS